MDDDRIDSVFRPTRSRGTKTHKRIMTVFALLGGWALLAVSGATPALAHATFAGSNPAEGSRLQAVPSKVTVTFSEDVTVGAGLLNVLDSTGNTVSAGVATSTGRDVSVPLRSGLSDGSYIVSYRTVSADSHPSPERTRSSSATAHWSRRPARW